jgi:hypothetical protein
MVLSSLRFVFRFPDPVDETSARLVATGVAIQAIVFLVVREGWLLVPLVYGFLARVLTGPTLSPLGQLVTRVVSPRVPGTHRAVPGPPKRFAQAIGLAVSGAAAIAWSLGWGALAIAAIGVLVAAATLEAVAAICLGCIVYRFLWECEDCDDISERLRAASAMRSESDRTRGDEVAAATR